MYIHVYYTCTLGMYTCELLHHLYSQQVMYIQSHPQLIIVSTIRETFQSPKRMKNGPSNRQTETDRQTEREIDRLAG